MPLPTSLLANVPCVGLTSKASPAAMPENVKFFDVRETVKVPSYTRLTLPVSDAVIAFGVISPIGPLMLEGSL